MKTRFSTILTVILVVALIAGAVCIGGVKGYKEEREELLLRCIDSHSHAGADLADSIADCEEDAADFDSRLKHKLMGKIASFFGVKPVSEDVSGLHAQLIRENEPIEQKTGLLEQIGAQVDSLVEDHVDTTLSLGKVFWTVILLFVIFGRKNRAKGFTLGKLLAGFGLFKMWKKN
ncbi:MAG: hypothetical protein IKL25_11045 [Clostridia bacterium]|nr:hypothetical protein [Clostridia bacterium]